MPDNTCWTTSKGSGTFIPDIFLDLYKLLCLSWIRLMPISGWAISKGRNMRTSRSLLASITRGMNQARLTVALALCAGQLAGVAVANDHMTDVASAEAVETVVLLDKGEPYDSMLADSGVFWITHSRRNFNSNYRLEAWSPSGQLLATKPLTHSLSTIKSRGDGSIMLTGINPTSRLTQYTTARLSGGTIQSTTTTINLGGFITFWVGSIGNRQFFIDQGGNPNDNSSDFNQPAQTIFTATTSTARYMSTRVRMPVAGHILGGKLVLVSSSGIGASGAKIVEVDPNTQAVRTLHESRTAGYSVLEPIPGQDLLLTNGRFDNKLVVLSRSTGSVQREFTTKGYTRSAVAFGNCVVAGNDETNIVEAFDLRTDATTPVLTGLVSLPAEEFSGIKRIAIDAATGTTFARASLACNPLIDACTNDFNRVVTLGAEFAAKLKAACQ